MNGYRLAANTFGDEELDAVQTVLASGRLTYGEAVRGFESEFAAWTGAKHAVMVNSGSSANLLAVESMLRRTRAAAPWKQGDEVLVSALAWPTSVWPLAQLGLIPVFADVDERTMALDLESAESLLTPKTKGMFVTHVLGQAPDLRRYTAFCEKYGLTLLEDACESLGAHCQGVHVGNFGSVGTYSTYFSHHISTIEGGRDCDERSRLG